MTRANNPQHQALEELQQQRRRSVHTQVRHMNLVLAAMRLREPSLEVVNFQGSNNHRWVDMDTQLRVFPSNLRMECRSSQRMATPEWEVQRLSSPCTASPNMAHLKADTSLQLLATQLLAVLQAWHNKEASRV